MRSEIISAFDQASGIRGASSSASTRIIEAALSNITPARHPYPFVLSIQIRSDVWTGRTKSIYLDPLVRVFSEIRHFTAPKRK